MVRESEGVKMLVCKMQEWKVLVQAVMDANGYDEEQAEWALECATDDIAEGEASYASAAAHLKLSVRLNQCGFDAADYLSRLV